MPPKRGKGKVTASPAATKEKKQQKSTSVKAKEEVTVVVVVEDNNNINKVVQTKAANSSTIRTPPPPAQPLETVAVSLPPASVTTCRAHSNEVIEEYDFSDSDLRALSDDDDVNSKVDSSKVDDKNENIKKENALEKNIIETANKNINKNDKNNSSIDNNDKESIKDNATTPTKDNENNNKVGGSSNDVGVNVDDDCVGQNKNISTAQNDDDTKRKNNILPANFIVSPANDDDDQLKQLLSLITITTGRIVDTSDDKEINLDHNEQLDNINKIDISTALTRNNNENIKNDNGDNGADVKDFGYEYNNEGEPEDEVLVQFLGVANVIAEARLAARRQARAEAREIRMRELERQQKEQEQNADRVFDMHTSGSTSNDPLTRTTRLGSGVPAVGGLLNATRVVNTSSMSSRRSSEDSLEEEGRSLRDIRHELKDVEERFRKAMIANAQLDNDRASQTFEVKLLKDKIETMQESYAQLEREFKEKSRDYNALKRNLDRLTLELKLVQGQLSERDTLIAEQGLVIVAIENTDGTDAKRALVSVENANVLASVQGSLDVRLKKFNEEKQQLVGEVQKLQVQLDAYKSEGKGRGNLLNGPLGSDDDYEAQREANKIISDYKYKLQKAEQENASLQASLARSETQVIRYKSTAEAAEKAEAELKVERRKLQRENREAMERLEELETSNNHLLKRLDKLKNAKSALLKDL